MKTQTAIPWLDQNGKLFSDEKIKSISKDWSAETWEEFLKATVESELSQNEVITPMYDSLCEEQTEAAWGSACRLPQTVQKEIHSAVRKLKERQRKIVRLHYWEEN